MTTIDVTPKPLLSRGMVAVTSAQFFSAFGDSALFFATLGILIQEKIPAVEPLHATDVIYCGLCGVGSVCRANCR
ncbi:lysophospholipid transporter LplT [Budvicia aquatica]|uniref:Lysophospholipid transporter LplT n=1 Tax=Budvicia aquatica TaxID=82979 RepID=A0A485A0N0_9GAMM|nr:lysophospholipid transporter LplT [Budvicia aquatica]